MWAVDIDQVLALGKATAESMKRDRVLVTGVVELGDATCRAISGTVLVGVSKITGVSAGQRVFGGQRGKGTSP